MEIHDNAFSARSWNSLHILQILAAFIPFHSILFHARRPHNAIIADKYIHTNNQQPTHSIKYM